MRIGITERGDAGLDLSWLEKTNACDGMILITKNANDRFAGAVMELRAKNFPCVVHATCTGWGGTRLEPFVPRPSEQIANVMRLVGMGFPQENIVLRIDPIIPTERGLTAVGNLVRYAAAHGLDFDKTRIRISVLDEYRHVKDRMVRRGLPTVYPAGQFQASPANFAYVHGRLATVRDAMKNEFGTDLKFRCCAEPMLDDPDLFIHTGCVSAEDLRLMGLPEIESGTNPQNRNGCECLSCKYELLENRHPCAHSCVYCYWKG